MVSIKEIRQSCTKRMPGEGEYFHTKSGLQRFYRNTAVYFTWIFLKLRLSPTHVSLLAGLMIVVSAVLLGSGNYIAGVIGALTIHLWGIFDRCDGQVSRVTKKASFAGDFMEGINHDLLLSLIFFSLPFSGYMITGNPLYIIAAAVLLFAYFGGRFMHINKSRIEITHEKEKRLTDFGTGRKKSSLFRVAEAMAAFPTHRYLYFVLAASLFGWIHYLGLFYAAYVPVRNIGWAYFMYRDLKKSSE